MAEMIYKYVEENPGCTAYKLAQALGCSRTKVEGEMSWLVTLCEDDDGHLYTTAYAWRVF